MYWHGHERGAASAGMLTKTRILADRPRRGVLRGVRGARAAVQRHDLLRQHVPRLPGLRGGDPGGAKRRPPALP
jgi:hypothetical protein